MWIQQQGNQMTIIASGAFIAAHGITWERVPLHF
jgi:hypothetical protein